MLAPRIPSQVVTWRRWLWCAAMTAWCVTPAPAQQLAFTSYTTSHGLSGNDVVAVVEDARGFLWIGTERGVSRFDGREFRRYGKEHGLLDERITSLLPAGDDGLWVGTWSAVFRFTPADGGRFSQVAVEGRRGTWERTRLAIDSSGRLWCGADGLYRLDRPSGVLRRVATDSRVALSTVAAVATDRVGNVWVASDGLYRVGPDGVFELVPGPAGITSLALDPQGRLWITAIGGFWRVDSCSTKAGPCLARRIVATEVIPWAGPVWTEDGVWAGSATGLLQIDRTDRVVRRVTPAHGLAAGGASPLLLDRRGDLWIGAQFGGLQRLNANGLTWFGERDGLEASAINSIVTTHAGELVAFGNGHVVQRFDGERFSAARPLMPEAVKSPGWGWYQVELQDSAGEWWMATDNGVVRWPAVRRPEDLARTRAKDVLARRGCFRGQAVFRLFEHSRRDLWIGTIEIGKPTIHRWSRATGSFECFSSARFLDRETAPTAFLEDRDGVLWIGFYLGQVARFRDGRFECVIDCVNPSQGQVTSMLVDRRHRLWITTTRAGLLRVDDPASLRPHVSRFTTGDGLTSNRTRAVLEDRFGRMYVGSDRGIDVLDSDGKWMGHYGAEDGLRHEFINMAGSGPNGDLWFGTLNGLARLRPLPLEEQPVQTPRILIDGLRAAGVPYGVPASGAEGLSGIVLQPDQRNLEVDFLALPRAGARALLFQYRLSDREAWSPPSPNRSVVLAGLSAGEHRLQVRAVDAGGRAQSPSAYVSFRVRAPLYQRGWFVGLVLLSGLGLGAGAYRARVSHLTALERQRTRIAMDLHDEMGSRLGSIGLLADLAADATTAGTAQRSRLEQIAETAADIGSSLSDIVWSLRQRTMTIEDVARHLAVHGRRLFSGPSPVLQTRFPDRWTADELSPAAGRAALLVGLEALHNASRHAHARVVTLELRPSGRAWVLVVADDGRGIGLDSEERCASGFGLETMKRRAMDIGATLQVDTAATRGTTVSFTFNPRAMGRRG